MAGFPKVRMLELELFQCLNRQLGYAGRLGVVAIELPLPARGSQTVGANCDHAFWFCPFGFQSVMPILLSSSRLWERAGITRWLTHVQTLLFWFRGFSSSGFLKEDLS
jgi:hypothetical protein